LNSTNSTNYRSDPVHLASDSEQLPKCFHDNRKLTSGRLAVPAWEMGHGHLLDRHAKPEYLGEDFRINHRAHRLDLDFVENTAVEDFESAINIADPDAKDDPHENIPAPGK